MENTNPNDLRTLWDLSWRFDYDDNDAEYDVCDSDWDWCCCLDFQKITSKDSDSYTRFCTWLAKNLELDDPADYQGDIKQDRAPCSVTCKVADLMWAHRDVFEPFFNENNKRGYRPKDYGDIDPDEDGGFFEAYMVPLESLIVGNYSDEDYSQLVEALQGTEEFKAPPRHTLAVKTYVYMEMKYGETQEEALDRLHRQIANAGLEILDPDTKNITVREEE